MLQHVLPKGFRRARNFGFLHPNCKRLIALLHLLLKFDPGQALAWFEATRADHMLLLRGGDDDREHADSNAVFRGRRRSRSPPRAPLTM